MLDASEFPALNSRALSWYCQPGPFCSFSGLCRTNKSLKSCNRKIHWNFSTLHLWWLNLLLGKNKNVYSLFGDTASGTPIGSPRGALVDITLKSRKWNRNDSICLQGISLDTDSQVPTAPPLASWKEYLMVEHVSGCYQYLDQGNNHLNGHKQDSGPWT